MILCAGINSLFCQSLAKNDPDDLVLLPGDHEIRLDQKNLIQLDARYQVGSEWGKKPLSREGLKAYPASFKKAALATLRVGGATGFYIGEYNGYHLVATNHHVIELSNFLTV